MSYRTRRLTRLRRVEKTKQTADVKWRKQQIDEDQHCYLTLLLKSSAFPRFSRNQAEGRRRGIGPHKWSLLLFAESPRSGQLPIAGDKLTAPGHDFNLFGVRKH